MLLDFADDSPTVSNLPLAHEYQCQVAIMVWKSGSHLS